MGRRGYRGDLTIPNGLATRLHDHLDWLLVRNYSEQTVEAKRYYLGHFLRWCETRGLLYANEVTKPILERYQRHLYNYIKPSGKPLSFKSQLVRLGYVRSFFSWLTKQNFLLYNPASDLELPKVPKNPPRQTLTTSEAEKILHLPDISTDLGLRDRALLETLYSTGIRRMELANLDVYDLNTERGTLLIREGKGKRDRTLPLGDRCLAWVEKYIQESRPNLMVFPDEPSLFLSRYGKAFEHGVLTKVVGKYVRDAKIGKTGSCHLFRHTMATLMLENGADIRFVQQMLGHASLETTTIYTHVSIRKLQEVHQMTHPGTRLHRTPKL